MKKSILILHASAQDGARIVAALSTKHFDVTCHSDARGAFASLGSHKPDFVVVDMDQTLADGTKLCRLIRADALTQRIPILLLTRKGMAAMFGIAVDLGAQGVASGDTPEQQAEDLTVLLERRRPHLPLHEKKRMSTLRSLAVLDTPNDPILDELVQAASLILGTPIAVVSLVDEHRQWFKAIVGLDAKETSRDVAFCAHTIHDSEVFEIADATKDVRFANNPLVTNDPSIRFYAGAPLITSEGSEIGTLCVIDRQPRALSQNQRDILVRLSRAVTLLLERNRQHAARPSISGESVALPLLPDLSPSSLPLVTESQRLQKRVMQKS